MKVILLKDVPKLGKKYDVKSVSDGHALNFLIPHKLVQPATADALSRVEKLKTVETEARSAHEAELVRNLGKVEGKLVTLALPANEKGHLFKGAHADEIAAAVMEQLGVAINPSLIILEHALKEVGDHPITIDVQNKSVAFTVHIDAL